MIFCQSGVLRQVGKTITAAGTADIRIPLFAELFSDALHQGAVPYLAQARFMEVADPGRAGTAKLHLAVDADIELSQPGRQAGGRYPAEREKLTGEIKPGVGCQEVGIREQFITFEPYSQGAGLVLIRAVIVDEFFVNAAVPLFAENKFEVPFFEIDARHCVAVRGQRRESDSRNAAIMGEPKKIRYLGDIFFHHDKTEPEFVIFALAQARFDQVGYFRDSMIEVFSHNPAISCRLAGMDRETDGEPGLKKQVNLIRRQMKAG